MALLLAMYQKLRLIRERNQLTLELTQSSSKLSRIEKNIERTQKYYTSLFAQLDSQAKMLQHNATSWLQQMSGLGVNSFNPYDYSTAFSGITGFVTKNMAELLTGEGMPYYKKGDNENALYHNIDNNKLQLLWDLYNKGNGKILPETEQVDGKEQYKKVAADKTYNGYDGYAYPNGITQADVDAFSWAMRQAQQNQQQAQFNVQQGSSFFANGVSIWTEARKAELECQQDAALEPLTYEQTMLELDKELKENRLKRIEAEIESYTQLADKGAEEMAPKFGLG